LRTKNANHDSEPEPKQVKHGSKGIADWLARLLREVVDFKAGQDCDKGQYPAEKIEEPRLGTSVDWGIPIACRRTARERAVMLLARADRVRRS